jgi:hypothetical protein
MYQIATPDAGIELNRGHAALADFEGSRHGTTEPTPGLELCVKGVLVAGVRRRSGALHPLQQRQAD